MPHLIEKYEGFREHAYRDQGGLPTIGIGTTIYPNGKRVQMGDTCTRAQAEKWLAMYLENEVNHYLDRDFPNLKPNQREALQSLLYNWGYGAFRSSRLYVALKRNDLGAIYHNWDIINVKGKPSLGLIRRRIEELELFFS